MRLWLDTVPTDRPHPPPAPTPPPPPEAKQAVWRPLLVKRGIRGQSEAVSRKILPWENRMLNLYLLNALSCSATSARSPGRRLRSGQTWETGPRTLCSRCRFSQMKPRFSMSHCKGSGVAWSWVDRPAPRRTFLDIRGGIQKDRERRFIGGAWE